MTREYNYAGGQNELVSYSKLADLATTKRHQKPPDGNQRKGEPDRQEEHRIHGRRRIKILAQDRQAGANERQRAARPRLVGALCSYGADVCQNDTSVASCAPRLSSVKST